MRKRKILNYIKKHWILIWLIVASLALVSVISFASYQEANQKLKRVVAPAASTDGLFTSNYLALGQNVIKPAYFQEQPYTYEVVLRNYNPVDPETVYNGTINYTLTATLVHADESLYNATEAASMTTNNQSITISMGSETTTLDASNLAHAFNAQTLSGKGSGGTDTWTVAYNNIGLDTDYCVMFTARTTNPDLEDIYATVIVASYPSINPQGWSCVLTEESSGNAVSKYDGFNYSITGTGKKTLKFSYDSTKLAINPACYDFITEIETPAAYYGSRTHANASDWRTVVINADPDTTLVNRYDIQMYKVNSYSPSGYSDISPNATNSYVEFEQ